MPPPTPPIPVLPSLDTPPSWHNRAGRVDRSCCFVLAAAPLWRQIPADAWHDKKPPAAPWTPAPHADTERVRERSVWYTTPDTPASNFRGRRPDRVGSIALTAEDLWHLHRFETPAPLRGDFRTTKSNAFKPAADATRWWDEVSAHEADAPASSPSAAASHAAEPPGNQDTPGRGPAAIGAAMNTSTACKKPLPSKLPGGRVTKLFLPLCTPREWEDAQRLLKRYAELFPGRTLRCRQCLGLRYGELKGLK